MTFTITVLGSSAMFATVDRAASGYLLQFAGRTVWMDAGGGTWRNLLARVDYADIDGILLSHRHPDHTIDLFQAYHARRYGSAQPLDRIPLWAPRETIGTLTGFAHDLADAFDLRPVGGGDAVDVFGARASFVEMAHPPETLGVRIDYDGAVLAYSADTGPAADFGALAGDAHLFLCEATFQDSDGGWEGHMRASEAGAAARDVAAEHLVLTHLPDGRDLGLSIAQATAAAGDGVHVRLATDGLRVEVGR